jgi:hypothetical protein
MLYSPVVLMSLFSSVLAILCPFYGYSLYKKFEKLLSDAAQTVKNIAFQPREQKPAGPIAARTRNLPAPVQRFFERSLRGDDRPFRCAGAGMHAHTVGDACFQHVACW